MPTDASATAPSEDELRRVANLARTHFGHESLKPGQAEVLARVLAGESVLAVLPTGGGKSLLYQLPALVGNASRDRDEGAGGRTTVVVSPLIALMRDQVESLPDALKGVTAAVSSQLPREVLDYVTREIASGTVRLVYAAPERLRSIPFLHALKSAGVARLVVDEAHCVSLWGHNFRPDYLFIEKARRHLGNPPVLALTATAPARVRDDVAKRLGIERVVQAEVVRENLFLGAIPARDADEKLAHVATLLAKIRSEARAADPGAPMPSGIVYASSRAKCETIAAALRTLGFEAEHYHAGSEDRDARQQDFMDGRTRVLVATVAFGMGIDKGDVRFIVHHDPPGSLEAYYQEAGRAGRDGEPARCVVIAARADASQLKRRARADVPDEKVVGSVLERLRAFADPDGWALVPPEALEDAADLSQGEGIGRGDHATAARVALGVLEQAGIVERHFDAPVLLTLRGARGRLADANGTPLTVLELAPLLDVGPERVEETLLDLEAAGELRFDRSERRHLVRIRRDASTLRGVLAKYGGLAKERADEMIAYVEEKSCLQSHLAKHFTGVATLSCGRCDPCRGATHELDASLVPDDEACARRVLEALSHMRGIGVSNLVRMLRGDGEAPDWTTSNPARGTLALRSAAVVRRAVDAVVARGLAESEALDHGGEALRITQAGRDALSQGGTLLARPQIKRAAAAPATKRREDAAAPATPPRDPQAGSLEAAGGDLFERLRAWRGGIAREARVPPYVVASDAVLRAIADARPHTPRDLLAVKGMGPVKVEMFADDILAIVEAYEREAAPQA